MKRWLVILLILLLTLPAAATEPPASQLEDILAEYMGTNGLNESNFSLSYYNTITGEEYAFNDKKFMVAGSTFKLPLNMYYYEMEQAGEIESDAYLPRTGIALDVAHAWSMVDSNNEVSIDMLYTLGDGTFSVYKEKLRKYFTMPLEEIDSSYFSTNAFCTNMMMDALKYLYEHREDFDQLIGYMKQAQQEDYFCAGVTAYEVAHKYGWYEGAVNDVGIIYTEEPFLLAVYTQDVCGEQVVADTAALVTQYNTEHAGAPKHLSEGVLLEVEMVPLPKEEPAEDPPAQPPAAPAPVPVPETDPVPFYLWLLPIPPGLVVLTVILLHHKHKKKNPQEA